MYPVTENFLKSHQNNTKKSKTVLFASTSVFFTLMWRKAGSSTPLFPLSLSPLLLSALLCFLLSHWAAPHSPALHHLCWADVSPETVLQISLQPDITPKSPLTRCPGGLWKPWTKTRDAVSQTSSLWLLLSGREAVLPWHILIFLWPLYLPCICSSVVPLHCF